MKLSLFKQWGIRLLILTGVIYAVYFLITVTGYSFVRGVSNSNQRMGSIAVGGMLASDRATFQDVSLPQEIASFCQTPLILGKVLIKAPKESETLGSEIEEIVVAGSRISTVEAIGEALSPVELVKKLGSKVAEREVTSFTGSYRSRIVTKGFYRLYPDSDSDRGDWNLAFSSRCFQVTRYFTGENGTPVRGADYIFLMDYSQSSKAIRFTPAYLAIRHSYAKSLAPSVLLQIDLAVDWISRTDYDEEVIMAAFSDSIKLENMPLGRPVWWAGDQATGSGTDELLGRSLYNAAKWLPAPAYTEDEIEQCIEGGIPCNLVPGSIDLIFTETGSGGSLVSELSLVLVQ